MPVTTPQLALPYPVGADDADVPSDMQALAERLEEVLASGHLSLTAPGDLKFSARNADHGRWLKCDGRELSQAEIEAALSLPAGDAAEFVALAKTGGISIYGSAATGKVRLPDTRRQIPLAAGPSGDGPGSLSDRPLGSGGGAETHTLTAAQTGLPAHTHAISSGSGEISPEDLAVAGGPPPSVNEWNDNVLAIEAIYDIDTQGTNGPNGSILPVRTPRNLIKGEWRHQQGNGGAPVTQYQRLMVSISATSQANVPADAAQAHNNMPPFLTVGWMFIRV